MPRVGFATALLQIVPVPIGCKTASWIKIFPAKCRNQHEEFGSSLISPIRSLPPFC